MTDPNIVHSGLTRRVQVAGEEYRIEIYRLEDETCWALEVVDKHGASTVWDHQFATDKDALDEVLRAIREEGAAAFREQVNIIPFPTR